jgi:enoyl-CoA hydratase/carnithine racemase
MIHGLRGGAVVRSPGAPVSPVPPAGPQLRCDRDGGVATVHLDRPEVRNALGTSVVAELTATLAELDADPDVRAVVLTGTPPGFCAGSDLKELARLSIADMVEHEARTGQAARSIGRLRIPVLSAVEGFAMGGGFLLAAACDVIVTAADARWHLPEVRLGWVPPWGLQALIDRIGPAAAKRIAWGDRPLTGYDVHRLGVADEVTAPGQAVRVARARAGRLAELPAHAVASTKGVFAEAMAGLDELLDAHSVAQFGRDAASAAAATSLSVRVGRVEKGAA